MTTKLKEFHSTETSDLGYFEYETQSICRYFETKFDTLFLFLVYTMLCFKSFTTLSILASFTGRIIHENIV